MRWLAANLRAWGLRGWHLAILLAVILLGVVIVITTSQGTSNSTAQQAAESVNATQTALAPTAIGVLPTATLPQPTATLPPATQPDLAHQIATEMASKTATTVPTTVPPTAVSSLPNPTATPLAANPVSYTVWIYHTTGPSGSDSTCYYARTMSSDPANPTADFDYTGTAGTSRYTWHFTFDSAMSQSLQGQTVAKPTCYQQGQSAQLIAYVPPQDLTARYQLDSSAWDVYVVWHKPNDSSTARKEVIDSMSVWANPRRIWLEPYNLDLLNQVSDWSQLPCQLWHTDKTVAKENATVLFSQLPSLSQGSFIAACGGASWTHQYVSLVNSFNAMYVSIGYLPNSSEFNPFFRECNGGTGCSAVFAPSGTLVQNAEFAPRAPSGWYTMHSRITGIANQTCQTAFNVSANVVYYSNASECGRKNGSSVVDPAQPVLTPTPGAAQIAGAESVIPTASPDQWIVCQASAFTDISSMLLGVNHRGVLKIGPNLTAGCAVGNGTEYFQSQGLIAARGYTLGSTEVVDTAISQCADGNCVIVAYPENVEPQGLVIPGTVFVDHGMPRKSTNGSCVNDPQVFTNAIFNLGVTCTSAAAPTVVPSSLTATPLPSMATPGSPSA